MPFLKDLPSRDLVSRLFVTLDASFQMNVSLGMFLSGMVPEMNLPLNVVWSAALYSGTVTSTI